MLSGYGFWLPNDPRGSGSEIVRKPTLAKLGEIHFGRTAVQPGRKELRAFHSAASDSLDYPPLWLNSAKRQAIASVFAEVFADRRYTVLACAILSNHAHLFVRRHRDDAKVMWCLLAVASRIRLRHFADIHDDHPVWADRPYKVNLNSIDRVLSCVRYINAIPARERLEPQTWPFVLPYDGWPHERKQ